MSYTRKNSDTQSTNNVVDNNTNKNNNVRKYAPDDLIPCTSIVQGELGFVGKKTKTFYRWFGAGETTEVEYQDLMSEIISRTSRYVYDPLFIIEDEELVNQRKEIKLLYDKMYSVRDLNAVLKMPIGQMKKTIINLPSGAKESLKVLAATNIHNGTLDSIKKISILDEILGTQLMTEASIQ